MTSTAAGTPTAPAGEERKDKEQGKPHLPHLPLPGMPMGMPTSTAGRVLWWGGLAALAAFDIVEWPVAVLVGTGSWVAEQYAKAAQSQRAEQQRQASSHMPSSA